MTTVVKVGNDDVVLDADDCVFSEVAMNDFLRKHPAKYDYLHNKHSEANFVLNRLNDLLEATEAKWFCEYKSRATGSDKVCESHVAKEEEVVEFKKKVAMAKRAKDLIWGHLRSMDRAYEAAKEMCYNLRKEMDKLNPYVKRDMNLEH